MRELIPSYLESNHRDSLRYQLCDILYHDYKGVTFYLDQQLAEKQEVLKKLYSFVKKQPEVYEHKGDNNYWYPYSGVDGTKNLPLYREFYPNTEDEITYFCKKGEKSFDHADYLFDPVKLQFFLMSRDIAKMDCSSETAKKILHINNEIFSLLYDIVGDTISYNFKNTRQTIENYINDSLSEEEKTKNDKSVKQDYQDYLIRQYKNFNDYVYLLDYVRTIVYTDKLEKELPEKNTADKNRNKL